MECNSPLVYLSCACVDTDWPGSRLFPSIVGTLHERELGVSTTELVTPMSRKLVVAPNVAVTFALPADLPSRRVLLDDAMYTTDASDESKLLWLVTS